MLLCGEEAEALYDMTEDPFEERNLVDGQPELAARLRREMLAALPAAQQPARAGEIDPAVAGTLRALGYME